MTTTMTTSPQLVLIAAVADNGVIGVDNALPWRIAEDLRRFKALTLGHPIIMGRKTWESLGRPLPGRHNIVITRQPAYAAPGATVVGSLAEALAACAESPLAFVIGGGEIYAQALPLAQRLELTEVHLTVAGDTRFPPFERADWRETRREHYADDAAGPSCDFVSYERRY
jgi:dihydrofolate reductase